MDQLLQGLRASAEPTRLRILALCAHGELSVSDLTQILGQSQPRVSRHLKLLCDAGLLDRFREGTYAYFRLSSQGACAELGQTLVDLVPAADNTQALDLERLEGIKRNRAEQASRYFAENAARWDEIRALHIADSEVEQAILDLLPGGTGWRSAGFGNRYRPYAFNHGGSGRALCRHRLFAGNAVGRPRQSRKRGKA